jgi:hypothetical protein
MTFSKQVTLLKKWLISTLVIAMVVAVGTFGFLYTRDKEKISPVSASEYLYFYATDTTPESITSFVNSVSQTVQVALTTQELLKPISSESGVSADDLASITTIENAKAGTSTVPNMLKISFDYTDKTTAQKILDSYSDAVRDYMKKNESSNAYFKIVDVNTLNADVVENSASSQRTTLLKDILASMLAGLILAYAVFLLRCLNEDLKIKNSANSAQEDTENSHDGKRN